MEVGTPLAVQRSSRSSIDLAPSNLGPGMASNQNLGPWLAPLPEAPQPPAAVLLQLRLQMEEQQQQRLQRRQMQQMQALLAEQERQRELEEQLMQFLPL